MAATPRPRRGADPSQRLVLLGLTGPAASIAWNVLAVALLLAWVRGVERRDLDSLRIVRPTGRDLESALVLFGPAMLWSWLGSLVLPPVDGPGRGSAEIVALPLLAVVAMVLTAAVFEEVLFRATRSSASRNCWDAGGSRSPSPRRSSSSRT